MKNKFLLKEGRYDCPNCKGSNTFSVNKLNGNYVYQCFRNRCATKGKVKANLNSQELLEYFAEDNDFESTRMHEFEFVSANRDRVVSLLNEYELSEALSQVDMLYDPKEDRLMLPLHPEGYIGRSINRNSLPKWKRYTKEGICYSRITTHDICIIVEDCLSAIKLPVNVSSIAILGTSLTDDIFSYILSQPFKKIVVALDKDASQKALQISRRLSPFIPTSCWFLKDDIKDIAKEELYAINFEMLN